MDKMNKKLNAFSLTALLLIAASISPASSLAANPCATADGYLDTGIGFMDLTNDSHPSKGIGGTGLTGDDDEKGIGGTGAVGNDNGIGGTGQIASKENGKLIYVTGTIHAFGSVCVNGVEIEYTEDTPVSTDTNQKLAASSLQVGQVVDIIAEKNIGGMPKAKNIAVRFALQGPVTKINPEGHLISIMGKPVQLASLLNGKQIKLGDSVRVSGLQNANGEIMATYVEPVSRQAPTRAVPSKIKIPFNIHNLSVQGYVQGRTPEGRVIIEGQSFDLGVGGRDIKVGTRMIVSGRRQQNGAIKASSWVHERTIIESRSQFGGTKGSDRQNRNRGRGRGRGGHDTREDNSGKGRTERPDDNSKNNRIERPDNSGSGKDDRPDRMDRPDKSGKSERPERPERPDRSGSGGGGGND